MFFHKLNDIPTDTMTLASLLTLIVLIVSTGIRISNISLSLQGNIDEGGSFEGWLKDGAGRIYGLTSHHNPPDHPFHLLPTIRMRFRRHGWTKQPAPATSPNWPKPACPKKAHMKHIYPKHLFFFLFFFSQYSRAGSQPMARYPKHQSGYVKACLSNIG